MMQEQGYCFAHKTNFLGTPLLSSLTWLLKFTIYSEQMKYSTQWYFKTLMNLNSLVTKTPKFFLCEVQLNTVEMCFLLPTHT